MATMMTMTAMATMATMVDRSSFVQPADWVAGIRHPAARCRGIALATFAKALKNDAGAYGINAIGNAGRQNIVNIKNSVIAKKRGGRRSSQWRQCGCFGANDAVRSKRGRSNNGRRRGPHFHLR